MADNKNMALDDEMMAKATGGAGEDLPQPRFSEGDKVVVEGWETYDSTVIQVMSYSESSNIWKYRVRIEKHEPGHEESMESVKLEDELSPA